MLRALVFICILFSYDLNAQWDWVSTGNNMITRDLITDGNGYSYAVFRTMNSPTLFGDPWSSDQLGVLVRYTPEGEIDWVRPQLNAHFDRLTIKEDKIYTVGHAGYDTLGFTINDSTWSWPFSNKQALLLAAFELDGTLSWVQLDTIWGSSDAYDIDVNDQHEIFVGGRISGTFTWQGTTIQTNSSQPTLWKYGPNGEKIWYHMATTLPNGKGSIIGVAAMSDGGATITGYFQGDTLFLGNDTLTRPPFFCTRILSDNSVAWTKDGAGVEGHDIVSDRDDNLYIAGSFFMNTVDAFSPYILSTPSTDIYVALLNGSGEPQWVRSSSSLPTTEYYSQVAKLRCDSNGEVGLLAYTSHGSVWFDEDHPGGTILISRLSSAGDELATYTMKYVTPSSQQIFPSGLGMDDNGRCYYSNTFRHGSVQYNSEQIDTDDSTYKTIVARTENFSIGFFEMSQNGLSIHPNPTRGIIYLDQAGPIDVEVRDAQGRLVRTFRSVMVIDIVDLPNGLYLLSIRNDDRDAQTQKVLLNK